METDIGCNMRPIIHTYIPWSVTSATKFKFIELFNEYRQVDENSDDAIALREAIKSLPGFPNGAPMDSDFLLEVTDSQH